MPRTSAYYALLDDLRERHPGVAWESCAAGGGRIDLGVIERVQRFWTSDMTDAIARQHIQRWTEQLVAPEYLGAHISAPRSHQTGRTLSLDFRAATAFFLAFGIEWDLTQATPDELEALAAWCDLHKRFRPLLHTGRAVRSRHHRPRRDRPRRGRRRPGQRARSATSSSTSRTTTAAARCASRASRPDAAYRPQWLAPSTSTRPR